MEKRIFYYLYLIITVYATTAAVWGKSVFLLKIMVPGSWEEAEAGIFGGVW